MSQRPVQWATQANVMSKRPVQWGIRANVMSQSQVQWETHTNLTEVRAMENTESMWHYRAQCHRMHRPEHVSEASSIFSVLSPNQMARSFNSVILSDVLFHFYRSPSWTVSVFRHCPMNLVTKFRCWCCPCSICVVLSGKYGLYLFLCISSI